MSQPLKPRSCPIPLIKLSRACRKRCKRSLRREWTATNSGVQKCRPWRSFAKSRNNQILIKQQRSCKSHRKCRRTSKIWKSSLIRPKSRSSNWNPFSRPRTNRTNLPKSSPSKSHSNSKWNCSVNSWNKWKMTRSILSSPSKPSLKSKRNWQSLCFQKKSS